jgi:hypothetical protein
VAQSRGVWRNATVLGAAGGSAFWITNFAISLTPIAAEYRAALTIPYLPMLLEALAGGLIVGLFVSFGLLRFFRSIPTDSPVLKSLQLTFLAFVVLTVVIEVPSKVLTPIADGAHYFAIGAVFNLLRFAALGLVIGWLYPRFAGK